ncbi:hypothetical protein [Flavobacterium sp. 3HN19-14]|uniref:hypothetical protein n=1 Tax=Flavobacterium sp. 3HN19-14 TaxID=3448133 RepID=UPI003EE10232
MASPNEIYQFSGQLFHQLKSRGFSLTIEDFNDAMLLLPEFEGDYDALKFRLASLVCINPSEQQDFYVIYDEVLEKFLRKDVINLKSTNTLWKWLLPAAGILLIIAFFILYSNDDNVPESIPIDYSVTAEVKRLEDTDIRLSHRLSLERFLENNKHIDKDKLAVDWTVDDSLKSDSIAFSHNFIDLRRHFYKVSVKSPEYEIDTVFEGNFLSRPKLHFTVNGSTTPADIVLGDSVKAAIYTNVAFRDSAFIYIKTNNKDSMLANAESVYFLPKKVGTYTFKGHVRKRFEKQPEDTASFDWSKPISIKVVPKPTLTVDADSGNLPPSYKKMKQPQAILAFLLLALLLWINTYFGTRKNLLNKSDAKKQAGEKHNLLTKEIKETFGGCVMPADVEWKDKNRLIRKDAFLYNMNKGLIQNIQTDRYEINIPATINKTANNIGIITPVRQRKIKQKRYIILVSRKNRRDTQFRLFDYLVQNLYNNNLPIDYYTYSDNFTITDRNNEVVSFADITNYSRQNSLIIFGDGHLFINFRTSKVDVDFSEKLSEWQNKILITPIPYSDWSAEEKILLREIAMVPAGIRGLLDIVRILNDETALYNYDHNSSTEYDFRNLTEVEKYLDDPVLFQWLCALAVYPKLYWELIIAFGDALFPEALNYPNLLKLARISWVKEAAFPVDIRLSMLKALDGEIEIKARALLLSLINDDLAGMAENSFSYEEKQIQKFTNSFVLSGSGNPQYHTPAIAADAQKFIALYKTGNINDNALKIYLDNKDKNWNTPIEANQGANSYIDDYEEKNVSAASKEELKKFYRRLIFPAILTTILFGLICWPIANLISRNFTWLDYFYETIPNQSTFDFKLETANCLTSKDELTWTFTNAAHSQPVVFKSGNGQIIRAATAILKAGKDYDVTISNGKNEFSGSFVLHAGKNYKVSLVCPHMKDPANEKAVTYLDTLSIQYENESQKERISELIKNLQSAGHYVSKSVMAPFNGNNEIHYYTPQQLKTAKALLAITGADFKVKKYEMSLPEKSNGSIKIFVKGVSYQYFSSGLVSIQYFPANMKTSTEAFRANLLKEGKFDSKGIELKESKDGNVVKYFNAADRENAAALAKIASAYFKKDIRAVAYKIANSSQQPIELWVTSDSYKIKILTNGKLTNNLKSVQADVKAKLSKIIEKDNYAAALSYGETDRRYYYGVVYYDISDAALAKQIASGLGKISYKDMNGNTHSESLMPSFSDNKSRKGDIDIYVRADDATCTSYKSNNIYTIYFSNDNKMVAGSELLLGKIGAIRAKDGTKITTQIVTYSKNTGSGKGTGKGVAMSLEVLNYLNNMGMDLKNVKTTHNYAEGSDCSERVELTVTYSK